MSVVTSGETEDGRGGEGWQAAQITSLVRKNPKSTDSGEKQMRCLIPRPGSNNEIMHRRMLTSGQT